MNLNQGKWLGLLAAVVALTTTSVPAVAQQQKACARGKSGDSSPSSVRFPLSGVACPEQ
jgi:hypothetical protein